VEGGAEQEERFLQSRDASDVKKPATAVARELASASTKASELRGVPAATSHSGWWAIPRTAAVAAPVYADCSVIPLFRDCQCHAIRSAINPQPGYL
jgi:hypothetical protein